MSDPIVEKPTIPPDYGNPTKRLSWADVEARIESATVYWLASTRPDGRPHVVPRDGVWLDGALYYGGSPETVHYKNISQNPDVVMHIGDGMEAFIVEGTVETEMPTQEKAQRLSDTGFAKYPQYGRMEPSMYMGGVSRLRPKRVLAWTVLFEDATRFTFPG